MICNGCHFLCGVINLTEMGGEHDTHGVEKKCIWGSGGET